MTFFLPMILAIVAIVLLAVIVGAFFFVIDMFLDLPYVATKKEKLQTIIKLANIKKKETVVDLGSGDGRLLYLAAEKGAKAIGYEINPYLVFYTRIRAKLKRLQITVLKQDLWKADLKVADVIFVYGRGETMKKFEDFVFKNTRKETRVIVNTDLTKPFPTKKPKKVENNIYLYQV